MASCVFDTLDLEQLYRRKKFLLSQIKMIDEKIKDKLKENPENNYIEEESNKHLEQQIHKQLQQNINNKFSEKKIIIKIKKISIKNDNTL